MPTPLSTIRTKARRHLLEETASFWTETELLDIILEGCKDLWGGIVDLHEAHFLTVDETNVSIQASSSQLLGVPAETFRVHIIEPRDTSTEGDHRRINFIPRDFNHRDFISARTSSTFDPSSGGNIYYCLTNAGYPISAPTVLIAPTISAAMNLRFVYVPGLGGGLTSSSVNPIPGESDQALIAWCVAYARAKEREDRSPDPSWIAVYATEKQNILTRLTPRQEQEARIVDALFESEW